MMLGRVNLQPGQSQQWGAAAKVPQGKVVIHYKCYRHGCQRGGGLRYRLPKSVKTRGAFGLGLDHTIHGLIGRNRQRCYNCQAPQTTSNLHHLHNHNCDYTASCYHHHQHERNSRCGQPIFSVLEFHGFISAYCAPLVPITPGLYNSVARAASQVSGFVKPFRKLLGYRYFLIPRPLSRR